MPLLIWTAVSFALTLLGLVVHSRLAYSIGVGLMLAAVAMALGEGLGVRTISWLRRRR